MHRGMSDAAKRRKKERKKAKKKMNVKDPTLAAMDQLAYSEFRVRVGVMQIVEYKIWAHDEDDAVNKTKEGHGREVSKSPPEVVSVQVGSPGGALTNTQAEETARVVENAQAQKHRHVQSVVDATGGEE